jgi:hypothetical protein
MYYLLGICLSLAVLLALNTLAAMGGAGVWRVLERRALQWTGRDRSRAIFALRVVPMVAVFLFVFGLLVPSYIAHEPHNSGEEVGWPMTLLASASIIGLGLAAWRGFAAWRATRKLLKEWLADSSPIALPGATAPAFRLAHSAPLLALVGVFRPRIFVSERLLEILSPEELAAAVQHELGHRAANDNLKRITLRACRDVLTVIPTGRRLDRAWADSAECAADEYAARQNEEASLNLASALVKIARAAPQNAPAALPAVVYFLHPEADGDILSRRVRNLAQGHAAITPAMRLDRLAWAFLAFTTLLTLWAASNPRATRLLHYLMEHIVAI